jgi:hypothetical protein
LVALTSGLAVWIFQSSNTGSVGASGLIFGYFGYVVLRGIFDRRLIDTLIGVVMAASFAYLVTIALPGTPGVSWLAHMGGLVGGVVGAWLLRDRRPLVASGPDSGSGSGTGSGTGSGIGSGIGTGSGSGKTMVPTQGTNPALEGSRSDLHKELGDLGLL